MDALPNAEPPDLALELPRDVFHQAIHTLCRSLPPPAIDTPEARASLQNAAMAGVASLLPATAEEAELAALYFAAIAQAHESMHSARQFPLEAKLHHQCLAQSANMMRQARGLRSLLTRVQAAREKRDADSAAREKAAWIEHCALGLMANALGRPNAPTAKPAPPSEPAPEPEPEDRFAALTEVEQYAVLYPDRARLIRQHGGLPPNCTFGPPEPDLVRAIVTGTTAILRELDPPKVAVP